MSKQFAKIPLEEQESIIYFDHYKNTVSIYSSRESICNKLAKILGKPNKIVEFNGKDSSYYYTLPMNDKKLTKILSVGMFIGAYLRKKNKDNHSTQKRT